MPLDQRHPFPLRLASCWNSLLGGRLAAACLATEYLATVYLAAVCLVAGCSPVPPSVVPVSGRVTLAGEPLAGAVVTFQPAPGESAAELSGSVGRTNAEGRYELRLVDPDVPGAVIGKHAVTITTAAPEAGDDAAIAKGHRTPPRWRDGSETYRVPAGGTDRADFEVE